MPLRIINDSKPRMLCGQSRENISGAINGEAVDDDNLEPVRRGLLSEYGAKRGLDMILFVKARDDNGCQRLSRNSRSRLHQNPDNLRVKEMRTGK